MLYKTIPCQICNGRGFTNQYTENSVSSIRCEHCRGSGELAAPITNGDLIRTCNNEQLTRVYANLKKFAIFSDEHRLLGESPEDFMLWLDKAADKTDLFTIFPFIDAENYQHPHLS